MKLKHPDILNLIDEKLDQKIRNVKIRILWDYMKSWTDIRCKARIQTLIDQSHLSYKLIEQ